MKRDGHRIRVAHCLETIYTGGVEQTRLSLARRLDPERFEQIVICTKALGDLPAQFEAAGCKVIPVGEFRKRIDWGVIKRAKNVLASFRPHIVHGAVFEGVVTAAIAGRWAGVPVVIGEETSEPLGRRWTGHLLLRTLSILCDRMVAVSPFVRDYLTGGLRITERKVALITNGVAEPPPATKKELESARGLLNLPDSTIVVGTVGRLLDSHKGISDAIRALQMLGPNVHLIIIGTGPDGEMLRDLAVELGLKDRVHFAGYQGYPRPFLELIDILLQPSRHEAFGLTIVEAMFAGLPVIGTRVGGIPGVIVEGETGLLVDPSAPPQLAQAIETLASSREQRMQMGKAGQERARSLFTEDRYAREVGAMYEKLAARRTRVRRS